ncbi:MAG: T9SS type A sorting domain-containing protein [Candidatus Zixiibacteriota bacterium]|nr:MAG: T9SS type A sorting domain-containing protein [candidate division Zixibacteria bacterium]
MFLRSSYVLICLILLSLTALAAPPSKTTTQPVSTATMITDNSPFIDANKILMFVTNHGNFGRDLAQIFGNDFGTFYPFIGTEYIEAEILHRHSPLYGAGLWFGGIYQGQTRVAIAEYSDEYVPGPMAGGTFQPDDPAFKVYKLYADSLEANPNADYLNWPTDQGAPLDDNDHPLCRGDQTLWTVFNDANPDAHTNDAGETLPLGIEARLMVWAEDEDGSEIIPGSTELIVNQFGETDAHVTVKVVEPLQLTGHDYKVIVDSSETLGPVWHLIDETTVTTVLENRPESAVDTVDGMEISVVIFSGSHFSCFEVVANAAGPIDPPEAGAAEWQGFPVPTDEYGDPLRPTSGQQATGDGLWLFHTADNGGTSCGGTRTSFDDFVTRVTRSGGNSANMSYYDYEMRFTGSESSPEVNGSYAIEWYNDDNVFWVPFELWRTGVGTPDDPSDDVRLFPFIIDDYGENWEGDDKYELESWGTCLGGSFSGEYEHSVSGDDDDPFTDWVYWILPVDDSPGEAGYLAAEADMKAGTFVANVGDHYGAEVMARTVLVNWNGGVEPTFTQNCPEQGTIFRITTEKEQPRDTFTFTAVAIPEITTGPEGQCLYLEYWVHNKGFNDLEDCYISFWSDPDLGTAGDDYVGCDTLDKIFFCYNADNSDGQYGTPPPAFGFKYLVGPIVPWPGETADLHGVAWPDHKDIGMTAFSKYINGTDPDNPDETYWYMQGLTKSGAPYSYDGDILTYVHSGDPVTAQGDLDMAPADRRMMASSGPFNFNPGDSLYVLLRMAVRHGEDNLDAVARLKEVLNLPFDIETDVAGPVKGQLPLEFSVKQNYPNPFNPRTTIQYALPERAHVRVDIYNILGQRVMKLVDKVQAAGEYSVVWDGTDEGGKAASTGVYFYKVTAGDNIEKKKMVLLK